MATATLKQTIEQIDTWIRSGAAARDVERLARDRLRERLARVEVAGRLVDPQALAGLLLDEQEAPVALDDGGHRHAGFPRHVHDPSFYRATRPRPVVVL